MRGPLRLLRPGARGDATPRHGRAQHGERPSFDRTRRTISGEAIIEVIPNCGHCPQLEVPEQLADLLLAFPGNLEYSED